MKRTPLKILAFVLAMIMMMGMLPTSMFAANNDDSVANYDDFLTELKQLELYAAEFSATYSSKTIGELVLNFIRPALPSDRRDSGQRPFG